MLTFNKPAIIDMDKIQLYIQIFLNSIHDTHVEHCIDLPAERKIRQVKTNINGNMPALHHTITKGSVI